MGFVVIVGMILYPKNGLQKCQVHFSDHSHYCRDAAVQVTNCNSWEDPQTLISSDRLMIDAFNLSALKEVMVPAISIALLGMVESLLCGASAGRMANKPLDSNQELVAQGIGNLVLPFWWDSCNSRDC